MTDVAKNGGGMTGPDPVNLPTCQLANLPPAKVGMLCFLLSEVAFFATLIMTYVFFLRQTGRSTPSPAQVFRLPLTLFATACLLSSSGTIHLAEKALRRGERRWFLRWWAGTITLGLLFLVCTAWEWSELIGRWGLTISRNMFGSTYFTLVGFHAAHVTVGVLLMTMLLILAQRREVGSQNATAVELTAWYWHFVDGVWVVVFTLVYLVGR
jgi:cytochrome c oxidase subunit 3/cytochrome o ubiquinol oxidase subunit 3